MAHIGLYLNTSASSSSLGLNNYIARELSPLNSNESVTRSNTPDVSDKETFVWRMQQPTASRKYQLFPTKDKLALSAEGQSANPDKAFALAMSQSGVNDRRAAAIAARSKSKEVSLTRRRKATIHELGPMTTVQEASMDSPTIPGRPPLIDYSHERSISAPGLRSNSWRQNGSADGITSELSIPAPDEISELSNMNSLTRSNSVTASNQIPRNTSPLPKLSFSPRDLAPLVIPTMSSPTPPKLVRSKALTNAMLSPKGPPPQVPPKSDLFRGNSSTKQPFIEPTIAYSIPQPESSTTPNSANLTLFTPSSEPPSSKSSVTRISEKEQLEMSQQSASSRANPIPIGHLRGQSDSTGGRILTSHGHRREHSETSVMDRGRPKRRTSQVHRPRRTVLEEQKAFETLPQGIKAKEADTRYGEAEIDALRKQALGQAAKFEVLPPRDVESLSRELRALDERCEYLRKTQYSLQAGRRNLHERICNFLRSPRVAVFSHESLLKQEEALAELDLSIEDWGTKLEYADNRRTRVRQKLLEHVAAALTLPETRPKVQSSADQDLGQEPAVTFSNVSFVGGLAGKTNDTPPRSPVQPHSPRTSPERLASPPEPLPSETMGALSGNVVRLSAESIRIYLESDVYGLLADVEDEMNRMASAGGCHQKNKEDSTYSSS